MIQTLTSRSIDLISRSITRGSIILKKQWKLQAIRHASAIPYAPVNRAQPRIPDILLIYQARTLPTTFVGVTKITTVIVFAFTTIFLAPNAYNDPDLGPMVALAFVAGSTLPLIFMGIYARPFVVSIHLRIPMQARESTTTLARLFLYLGLDNSELENCGRPRLDLGGFRIWE